MPDVRDSPLPRHAALFEDSDGRRVVGQHEGGDAGQVQFFKAKREAGSARFGGEPLTPVLRQQAEAYVHHVEFLEVLEAAEPDERVGRLEHAGPATKASAASILVKVRVALDRVSCLCNGLEQRLAGVTHHGWVAVQSEERVGVACFHRTKSQPGCFWAEPVASHEVECTGMQPIESPIADPAPPSRSVDDTNAAEDTPPGVTGVGALAGAIRVVSGLTLVSRFAGLARDVITARLFGDGVLGSAFRAAYLIPNVFRRLFGEGALSAAFLPEYTMLKREDAEKAKALASVVIWKLTLATGVITALVVTVLALRLFLFAAKPDTALSIKLMLLMLPMMPAVCLTAILGGVLQSHGRFAIPAAAPIVLNLFQIGAGIPFYFAATNKGDENTLAAYIVGAAALIASWATVLWSAWALRGKVNFTPARKDGSGGGLNARELVADSLANVKRRFIPAMLGLGTLQLNTMLDTVVAMWPNWIGPTMFGRPVPLDLASNGIVSYTQTLYQFPLGVFGIAVATAVFPLLSRSSDKPAEFAEHLRRGLRLSLFIALPATLGLILVRHELVYAVFGGGSKSFTPEGLERAAAVLLGFAPGVWAYSLDHVLTRAYYAKGDTTTPMRIAMGCVLMNVVLNFTLIWSLREAGLAWATATSALVQFCALLAFAPKRLGVSPFDRSTLAAFARIAICGAIMAACVLLAQRGWDTFSLATKLGLNPEGWKGQVAKLTALVVVGMGSYALASLFTRAPEAKWMMQKVPKGESGAAGMSFE